MFISVCACVPANKVRHVIFTYFATADKGRLAVLPPPPSPSLCMYTTYVGVRKGGGTYSSGERCPKTSHQPTCRLFPPLPLLPLFHNIILYRSTASVLP